MWVFEGEKNQERCPDCSIRNQVDGDDICGNREDTLFLFLRFYLVIFGEWGREGEREKEKHQCVTDSHMSLTGDLAHCKGMCPDWELNRQPFDS